jgi:hypothetical protein|tara:strand:+ start:1277 stop:1576 length:300 start_codon:yes stop_codon:yes gene_type:complete
MKYQPNNALWASAFVLLGMILFTANKHVPTAIAETSITGNGFTLVTTQDGRGADFLYVVDDVNSVLMVYNVQNPQGNSTIKPIVGWRLPAMFSVARNRK